MGSVYFYSTTSALMTGLASEGVSLPMSQFLSHGDHGLGTFAHMDGELVVIDGAAYQLKADGTLSRADSGAPVAFGVLSSLPSQIPSSTKRTSSRIKSLDDLNAVLDELAPHGINQFVAFRVDGRFTRVKVRAIHAQSYSDQPLSELGKDQAVHAYSEVTGSLVGVRSPAWTAGFSVVGMHVHFIDAERTRGGHVLELDLDEGAEVVAVRGTDLRIELPTGNEFGDRQVTLDEDGLKKVEG